MVRRAVLNAGLAFISGGFIMKVYLITCGEYSEYQVCGILIDKEKAERFCAEWNSSWYFNCGDIDIDLVRVSSEPFRVE